MARKSLMSVYRHGAAQPEARFAREVGYHAAMTPDGPVKFITGSGGGTMLEPLAGAQRRQEEEGVLDARRCGMTCGMIIAAGSTDPVNV